MGKMVFSFPFFQVSVLSSFTSPIHRILIPGIQVSWDELWFDGGDGEGWKWKYLYLSGRFIESENRDTEWKRRFLVIRQRTICMSSIYSLFFSFFLFFGGKWVGSVEGILSIVFGGEARNILAPCVFFLEYSNHFPLKWKHTQRLWFKENVLLYLSWFKGICASLTQFHVLVYSVPWWGKPELTIQLLSLRHV